MRELRRLIGSTLVGVLMVAVLASPALAEEPAWGDVVNVGSTTSSRQALAYSSTSSAEFLHSVTSTVEGSEEHMPDGLWYRRTSTDGASWSKVKRLAPVSHAIDRASVAATQDHVYVAWVRFGSNGAPRTLYVRRNTEHGNLSAWSDRVRLTSTTARIDAPSIAAAGRHVFVAYTNARTGTIRLQTSHDRGRSWSSRSLGTSTAIAGLGWTDAGRSGAPIVVATGSKVGLFWVADADGTIKGRISVDSGAHWGPASTLGVGGYPAATARAGRIAVASSDGTTPGWFRVWGAGAWSPPSAVPDPVSNPEPPLGFGGPVAKLGPSGAIGIAYSVRYASLGEHSDMTWRVSLDGGATWQPDETVSIRFEIILNSGPSVAWTADAIHIQWSDNHEGDRGVRLRTKR